MVSILLNRALPLVSALLFAIVIGAIIANIRPIPLGWRVGLSFASKYLLRAGIVLLGLQISVGALLSLGWQTLVLVVLVVAIGVTSTMLIGRAMKMPFKLVALVGCGFSICGAAAVAAAKESVDADENQTATAIGLVVIFGTLSIPIVPALAHMMSLDTQTAGTWIGGSIHEVAQVVAAGAAMGEQALQIAVIVKLARVICLAGVMAVFGIVMRRAAITGSGKRPPLIPGFVIGFLIMVALNSLVAIPALVAAGLKWVQTILLTMAMAGLGCGINIRQMLQMGHKPILLGLITTAIVSVIALCGAIWI